MGQVAAKEFGDKYLHLDRAEAQTFMQQYALDQMITSLKADSALIGVHFDRWFSEKSLYDDGTYGLAFNKPQRQEYDCGT